MRGRIATVSVLPLFAVPNVTTHPWRIVGDFKFPLNFGFKPSFGLKPKLRTKFQPNLKSPSVLVTILLYTVFRKNTHFCFLAYLLEKVTTLNENFRQNS